MKFFRLFLVILFICLCASKLSAGKIYVWTDESGQKHFSNVSPPDKKLQNLEIRETDNHRTESKPTKSSQQQSDQVARKAHYLYDEGYLQRSS